MIDTNDGAFPFNDFVACNYMFSMQNYPEDIIAYAIMSAGRFAYAVVSAPFKTVLAVF